MNCVLGQFNNFQPEELIEYNCNLYHGAGLSVLYENDMVVKL
jgi:hypothetical protein